MSVSLVLLVLLGGVLLVPLLGGDEDDGNEIDNEILGGPNDDVVDGTPENDLIRTFLGNDEIYGNDGNDNIRAGDGEDYVEGGFGNDFVRAGAGNDEIYGQEGVDRLYGEQGDDYIDGGTGADIIRGGWGDDLILGRGGADQMTGADDDDTIFGWQDGTFMSGGQNDLDNPGSSNDTLVMVTGDGVMENRTDNDMNIALANVSDGQETFITVNDFDPDDDILVLTVDYATTDGADVEETPDFTVTYAFLPATETSGAGMEVTVTWDNPAADVDDQESARAFLVGITAERAGALGLDPLGGTLDPDDPNAPIDVDVYLTNEASIDDPIATLDQMGITTPAIDAWRASSA